MRFIRTIISIALLNLVVVASFLYVGSKTNTSVSEVANPLTTVSVSTSTTTSSKKIIPATSVKPAPVVKKPTTPVVSNPATQTQPPTSVETTPPTPPPPPVVDNRCIVTIQGKRYDVTNFRNAHSGGDIFQCGIDMTSTFFGQHNQALLDSSLMQALIVP